MPHLFESLALREALLRNRIGVSPMCQYSANDGMANDWHLVHLGSRAVGGAGLVMVEATAVEAQGRISPHDVGLWSDAHVEPLARVVRFVADHGALPAIQLAHAGRKASTARPWEGGKPLSDEQGGWPIAAPSAIPFAEGYRTPTELSHDDIRRLQASFRAAAARAREAGFMLLELHGAHGYLIHSFHSPLSNQRTDDYGGSFENRVRFTIETVRELRKEWPEARPLAVRLSCTDWLNGGWTLEDSIALAEMLKREGVDLIDCSSGGISPNARIPSGASYQVPFSEAIRHGAGIPTAAVGMIWQPMQADDIIRNGRADLVLLGREMLRDPYWPIHAAQVLRHPLPVPSQYQRAF